MSVSLDTPDAEDLAGFLRFLGEWLTSGPEQLGDSLAHLMDSHPCGIGMLRHDLARFSALLSTGNDGAS